MVSVVASEETVVGVQAGENERQNHSSWSGKKRMGIESRYVFEKGETGLSPDVWVRRVGAEGGGGRE